MKTNELISLITKTAKAVEASEKLPLPILAAKARREAKARPTDVPLINASQVLTKMASDKTFITKDEFRGIINQFHASHSKLAQVFSDELGKQTTHTPQTFVRDQNEGISLETEYNRFADPILSNALSAAMDANPTERLYSQADAQKAHRAVYAKMLDVGLEPKDIQTFAGRNDIIICQTSHETPKGIAHTLLPVEIKEGKAIMPEFFLSREGFKDVTKGAMISHIMQVANKAFQVDGAALLGVLEQVKNGNKEVASDVEIAAIKVASDKGTPSIGNAVLYGELIEPQKDVELPKVDATEESSFAERLGNPEGIAKFRHGERVVEAGRSMLTRKLAEIGYNSVQVKVADVEDDKIFYAVAIGTGTGLQVPVEIVGNLVVPPKIVFADGFVTSFSKEAISEIVNSQTGGNKKALAAASPCYDMKPTELLDVVKKSVAEGNLIRAEEAINVLGEIDPVAQKVAIAHMMMNIYEPGQNPNDDMANMQKLANKPVYDVPQFMNYKIFFPEGA